MKSSQLLKKAKKYLWDGESTTAFKKTEYICAALSKADSPESETVLKLQKEIESRLYPYNNMFSWLVAVQGIKDVDSKRLQNHRLQWMNLLIEEYAANGD